MLFWSGGMCNFLLSFILLFNTLSMNQNVCKVEKIECITSNNSSNNIYLTLEIQSTFRDIFELNIYFYNSNKKLLNDKYYSSALAIQGKKSTEAKVPVEINDMMYLNIVVYSGN